ncbi:STAS domain-containing protein [Planosporangium thailandense]|uniref:STAS domain-containing protein n=1 Tax=Planosporangium thailandense TaxID=765197 RepID=A0ABX0Y6U9_9ACTN|nr:STAS domain-containing protein [Planosporangium thailandense]NJC73137.1 STAS domain-containing protein [Planosporangium thailandense]
MTWSRYEVRGVAVLALTGKLCAATVLTVEPEVAWLLAGERPVLVMDLAGLETCDSAGLAMLDACDRAATTAGIELRLAAPTHPVSEALRARGLISRLRIFGSVDGAARADALDLLPATHPVVDPG